jgi:hypothetical protein
VYDTEGVNGIKDYYVCVRECQGGLPGILLSFSEIWGGDDYQYKFNVGTYTIYIHKGVSEEAMQSLAQMSYKNNNILGWIQSVAEKCPEVRFISDRSNYGSWILWHLVNGGDEHGYMNVPFGDPIVEDIRVVTKRFLSIAVEWYDYTKISQREVVIPSYEIVNHIPRFKVETDVYRGDGFIKSNLYPYEKCHSELFHNTLEGEKARFTIVYPPQTNNKKH